MASIPFPNGDRDEGAFLAASSQNQDHSDTIHAVYSSSSGEQWGGGDNNPPHTATSNTVDFVVVADEGGAANANSNFVMEAAVAVGPSSSYLPPVTESSFCFVDPMPSHHHQQQRPVPFSALEPSSSSFCFTSSSDTPQPPTVSLPILATSSSPSSSRIPDGNQSSNVSDQATAGHIEEGVSDVPPTNGRYHQRHQDEGAGEQFDGAVPAAIVACNNEHQQPLPTIECQHLQQEEEKHCLRLAEVGQQNPTAHREGGGVGDDSIVAADNDDDDNACAVVDAIGVATTEGAHGQYAYATMPSSHQPIDPSSAHLINPIHNAIQAISHASHDASCASPATTCALPTLHRCRPPSPPTLPTITVTTTDTCACSAPPLPSYSPPHDEAVIDMSNTASSVMTMMDMRRPKEEEQKGNHSNGTANLGNGGFSLYAAMMANTAEEEDAYVDYYGRRQKGLENDEDDATNIDASRDGNGSDDPLPPQPARAVAVAASGAASPAMCGAKTPNLPPPAAVAEKVDHYHKEPRTLHHQRNEHQQINPQDQTVENDTVHVFSSPKTMMVVQSSPQSSLPLPQQHPAAPSPSSFTQRPNPLPHSPAIRSVSSEQQNQQQQQTNAFVGKENEKKEGDEGKTEKQGVPAVNADADVHPSSTATPIVLPSAASITSAFADSLKQLMHGSGGRGGGGVYHPHQQRYANSNAFDRRNSLAVATLKLLKDPVGVLFFLPIAAQQQQRHANTNRRGAGAGMRRSIVAPLPPAPPSASVAAIPPPLPSSSSSPSHPSLYVFPSSFEELHEHLRLIIQAVEDRLPLFVRDATAAGETSSTSTTTSSSTSFILLPDMLNMAIQLCCFLTSNNASMMMSSYAVNSHSAHNGVAPTTTTSFNGLLAKVRREEEAVLIMMQQQYHHGNHNAMQGVASSSSSASTIPQEVKDLVETGKMLWNRIAVLFQKHQLATNSNTVINNSGVEETIDGLFGLAGSTVNSGGGGDHNGRGDQKGCPPQRQQNVDTSRPSPPLQHRHRQFTYALTRAVMRSLAVSLVSLRDVGDDGCDGDDDDNVADVTEGGDASVDNNNHSLPLPPPPPLPLLTERLLLYTRAAGSFLDVLGLIAPLSSFPATSTTSTNTSSRGHTHQSNYHHHPHNISNKKNPNPNEGSSSMADFLVGSAFGWLRTANHLLDLHPQLVQCCHEESNTPTPTTTATTRQASVVPSFPSLHVSRAAAVVNELVSCCCVALLASATVRTASTTQQLSASNVSPSATAMTSRGGGSHDHDRDTNGLVVLSIAKTTMESVAIYLRLVAFIGSAAFMSRRPMNGPSASPSASSCGVGGGLSLPPSAVAAFATFIDSLMNSVKKALTNGEEVASSTPITDSSTVCPNHQNVRFPDIFSSVVPTTETCHSSASRLSLHEYLERTACAAETLVALSPPPPSSPNDHTSSSSSSSDRCPDQLVTTDFNATSHVLVRVIAATAVTSFALATLSTLTVGKKEMRSETQHPNNNDRHPQHLKKMSLLLLSRASAYLSEPCFEHLCDAFYTAATTTASGAVRGIMDNDATATPTTHPRLRKPFAAHLLLRAALVTVSVHCHTAIAQSVRDTKASLSSSSSSNATKGHSGALCSDAEENAATTVTMTMMTSYESALGFFKSVLLQLAHPTNGVFGVLPHTASSSSLLSSSHHSSSPPPYIAYVTTACLLLLKTKQSILVTKATILVTKNEKHTNRKATEDDSCWEAFAEALAQQAVFTIPSQQHQMPQGASKSSTMAANGANISAIIAQEHLLFAAVQSLFTSSSSSSSTDSRGEEEEVNNGGADTATTAEGGNNNNTGEQSIGSVSSIIGSIAHTLRRCYHVLSVELGLMAAAGEGGAEKINNQRSVLLQASSSNSTVKKALGALLTNQLDCTTIIAAAAGGQRKSGGDGGEKERLPLLRSFLLWSVDAAQRAMRAMACDAIVATSSSSSPSASSSSSSHKQRLECLSAALDLWSLVVRVGDSSPSPSSSSSSLLEPFEFRQALVMMARTCAAMLQQLRDMQRLQQEEQEMEGLGRGSGGVLPQAHCPDPSKRFVEAFAAILRATAFSPAQDDCHNHRQQQQQNQLALKSNTKYALSSSGDVAHPATTQQRAATVIAQNVFDLMRSAAAGGGGGTAVAVDRRCAGGNANSDRNGNTEENGRNAVESQLTCEAICEQLKNIFAVGLDTDLMMQHTPGGPSSSLPHAATISAASAVDPIVTLVAFDLLTSYWKLLVTSSSSSPHNHYSPSSATAANGNSSKSKSNNAIHWGKQQQPNNTIVAVNEQAFVLTTTGAKNQHPAGAVVVIEAIVAAVIDALLLTSATAAPDDANRNSSRSAISSVSITTNCKSVVNKSNSGEEEVGRTLRLVARISQTAQLHGACVRVTHEYLGHTLVSLKRAIVEATTDLTTNITGRSAAAQQQLSSVAGLLEAAVLCQEEAIAACISSEGNAHNNKPLGSSPQPTPTAALPSLLLLLLSVLEDGLKCIDLACTYSMLLLQQENGVDNNDAEDTDEPGRRRRTGRRRTESATIPAGQADENDSSCGEDSSFSGEDEKERTRQRSQRLSLRALRKECNEQRLYWAAKVAHSINTVFFLSGRRGGGEVSPLAAVEGEESSSNGRGSSTVPLIFEVTCPSNSLAPSHPPSASSPTSSSQSCLIRQCSSVLLLAKHILSKHEGGEVDDNDDTDSERNINTTPGVGDTYTDSFPPSSAAISAAYRKSCAVTSDANDDDTKAAWANTKPLRSKRGRDNEKKEEAGNKTFRESLQNTRSSIDDAITMLMANIVLGCAENYTTMNRTTNDGSTTTTNNKPIATTAGQRNHLSGAAVGRFVHDQHHYNNTNVSKKRFLSAGMAIARHVLPIIQKALAVTNTSNSDRNVTPSRRHQLLLAHAICLLLSETYRLQKMALQQHQQQQGLGNDKHDGVVVEEFAGSGMTAVFPEFAKVIQQMAIIASAANDDDHDAASSAPSPSPSTTPNTHIIALASLAQKLKLQAWEKEALLASNHVSFCRLWQEWHSVGGDRGVSSSSSSSNQIASLVSDLCWEFKLCDTRAEQEATATRIAWLAMQYLHSLCGDKDKDGKDKHVSGHHGDVNENGVDDRSNNSTAEQRQQQLIAVLRFIAVEAFNNAVTFAQYEGLPQNIHADHHCQQETNSFANANSATSSISPLLSEQFCQALPYPHESYSGGGGGPSSDSSLSPSLYACFITRALQKMWAVLQRGGALQAMLVQSNNKAPSAHTAPPSSPSPSSSSSFMDRNGIPTSMNDFLKQAYTDIVASMVTMMAGGGEGGGAATGPTALNHPRLGEFRRRAMVPCLPSSSSLSASSSPLSSVTFTPLRLSTITPRCGFSRWMLLADCMTFAVSAVFSSSSSSRLAGSGAEGGPDGIDAPPPSFDDVCEAINTQKEIMMATLLGGDV